MTPTPVLRSTIAGPILTFLLACWSGSCPVQAATAELPVLTNAWEQAHLFISLKDTNGVLINANDRYLQSVQAAFPQIHSLADLIGKDDFFFYPADLATKYRADDQKVMQGGVLWETIEENQLQGGARTYVYVSKTPLRDARNQIYALLIEWYDIPAPNQTVLPVFTNVWDKASMVIIDKNTNSVFINANENFLKTLRPSFPEIRSVTNLIGKDDFYFYPPEMADKFRADDQRVMSSGQPWSGIEENQPLGGKKTYSHVTKTPLRDAVNRVFGLHIVAFPVPYIAFTRKGSGLELTWDDDGTGFSLQQAVSMDPAAVWRRVDAVVQVTNGQVRVQLPLTQTTFFRLVKEPYQDDGISKVLGQSPVFNGLSREEIDQVLPICQLNQYKQGDHLIRANTELDRLFILRDGQAGVYVGAHSDVLVATLGSNSLLGEIEFVDHQPASAEVVMLTVGEGVEIGYAPLRQLCERSPLLGYKLMSNVAEIISAKLRETNARLGSSP